MLKLILLFPHLSLLRNLSSIWALPYKNIHKIARDNFNILVKVKNDIQRWKNLKVSLQGRISTVKMIPNRLGDNYKFAPVVANSIKIWKTVERRIGGPFKFCNSTPLWHNFNFVCGNRPFVQPSWSSLGVNTCGDIYDNQGLCSFQTFRTKFCLPASAYFVFLQLRSALKAYGVPWSSPISSHPMRDWIAPSAGRPSVSLIYNKIIDCITKPLSIKTI